MVQVSSPQWTDCSRRRRGKWSRPAGSHPHQPELPVLPLTTGGFSPGPTAGFLEGSLLPVQAAKPGQVLTCSRPLLPFLLPKSGALTPKPSVLCAQLSGRVRSHPEWGNQDPRLKKGSPSQCLPTSRYPLCHSPGQGLTMC